VPTELSIRPQGFLSSFARLLLDSLFSWINRDCQRSKLRQLAPPNLAIEAERSTVLIKGSLF
jgi:hypothetical protein